MSVFANKYFLPSPEPYPLFYKNKQEIFKLKIKAIKKMARGKTLKRILVLEFLLGSYGLIAHT